jgi:hypothetical protein
MQPDFAVDRPIAGHVAMRRHEGQREQVVGEMFGRSDAFAGGHRAAARADVAAKCR